MSFRLFGSAQDTTTFTIEGMTCKVCANNATKVLRETKGVDSALVDFETKVAIVIGKITESDIKNSIKKSTNFEALFQGDSLTKPLTDDEKKDLDILTIKGGGKIKFKDHLAQDKITMFEFYADWCKPCLVFSPKVEQYIKDNQTVALRKVDIVDWKSDISKQLTKHYQMPAIPFILIFNSQGDLIGKVEGNSIKKVTEIIQSNRK